MHTRGVSLYYATRTHIFKYDDVMSIRAEQFEKNKLLKVAMICLFINYEAQKVSLHL